MKQDVNNYLKSILTNFESYTLTKEDIKKVERDKTAFILEKFSRKKYRRRKLSEETKKSIEEKICLSVKDNRPLHLVVPFGGYKHFWNPSHPEPDWAELFNFRFLAEYASPAIAVHKPGVLIEYMSEDLILTRMNNYPKKNLDTYSKIFNELIEWYNQQTPDNLKFKFFRVIDKCDSNKIVNKVETMLPGRRKAFEKLPIKEKDQELHRSSRSMYWKGDKDLTGLTAEEKKQRIVDSRLIELAYYDVESEPEFMGDYLFEDNHICVCFSFGTTHDNDEYQDLTLATTYGSVVDHWIGRGVLVEHGARLLPSIVSQTQYAKAKNIIKTEKVDGLLPYKNYQTIDILGDQSA